MMRKLNSSRKRIVGWGSGEGVMMLIRTNPQVTYRPRNSCNSLLCEVRPCSCSTSWHRDIYSQTEWATELMESLTCHWPCSHSLLQNGAGIPQMVQRPTEIPRRNTDAGSSPRCRKGFFSLGSAFRADSLTVSVQPSCGIACINDELMLNVLRCQLTY